ncbi:MULTISPECIES: hypothetical protein [Streptosporangium]|uniref:Uncharacterized protein n=1 Tax=Streptosporangium brasiliense TaxID=47480 RepID=A0ABT9R1C0_9ACTN|nr:hypothetical protein [Streptosporangium brasiliense]MDP9863024.1 hypothetical protein [Streptosporangium brasiliense]
MGFPGEPPRRQPYVQPDASPPAQGERWFEPAPQGHSPGGPGAAPYGRDRDGFDAAPHGRRPDGFDAGPYDRGPDAPHGRRPDGFDAGPYGHGPDGPEAGSHGPGPDGPATPARPARPGRQEPPQEPRQAMWSPYDEGPRSRRPIFIAVGALGVLVAGGVGLAMLANSDPAPQSATASPPSRISNAPVPNNPGDKFGFAASRTTDPYPLTLKEVFKRANVSHGGQRYLMTISRLDKKCKDAVVGSKLQKALTAGKCTQILRASFRDASGKIIGTVGVANLRTSAAASKVVSVGAGKSREEYLKALPGKDKVTKFLGTGEAFAGGWTHGHYAVMVWFQYKDGHLPKKTEVKKLNQAAFGAADATVSPALESRSLTGRRP